MSEFIQTPDSTPRWERARRNYPEAYAALQRVAEAVYERTEEPVDVGDAEVGLPAAVQLGFLERGDEGVSFSEPDVRRDYLIRHVTSVALPAWDDPTRFADTLADAQRRTLGLPPIRAALSPERCEEYPLAPEMLLGKSTDCS